MNVYEAILKEANRRRAAMPKRVELGTPVRLEDLPKHEVEYLERVERENNGSVNQK